VGVITVDNNLVYILEREEFEGSQDKEMMFKERQMLITLI
jgi:hypothetical protein